MYYTDIISIFLLLRSGTNSATPMSNDIENDVAANQPVCITKVANAYRQSKRIRTTPENAAQPNPYWP